MDINCSDVDIEHIVKSNSNYEVVRLTQFVKDADNIIRDCLIQSALLKSDMIIPEKIIYNYSIIRGKT